MVEFIATHQDAVELVIIGLFFAMLIGIICQDAMKMHRINREFEERLERKRALISEDNIIKLVDSGMNRDQVETYINQADLSGLSSEEKIIQISKAKLIAMHAFQMHEMQLAHEGPKGCNVCYDIEYGPLPNRRDSAPYVPTVRPKSFVERLHENDEKAKGVTLTKEECAEERKPTIEDMMDKLTRSYVPGEYHAPTEDDE